MERVVTVKNGIALAVVLILSLIAYLVAPEPGFAAGVGPWYSVIPPLLAVTLAIVSSRIVASLLIAIFVGGLLNTIPAAPLNPIAWIEGFQNGLRFIWISITSGENLLILAFVVLVLAMISVVIVAGGLHAIVQWLSRFAKGPRSAQCVAYLMGLVIFIDDDKVSNGRHKFTQPSLRQCLDLRRVRWPTGRRRPERTRAAPA